MRLFYILLIAAFLSPVISFAQGNYKPGYVVTLQGDTLKGLIEERSWDENPRTIMFKKADTEKSQKLSSADISFFSIDGLETYKSCLCQISLGTTNENHLYGKDTTTKIDTVFLQVLQKGKNISLLSYTDDIKTRYYYSEAKNDIPQELLFRVFFNTNTPTSDVSKTLSENIFKQQLGSLALKYGVLDDDLQKTLDKAEYSENNVLKIAAKINGMGIPVAVKKKKNYTKLIFGLTLFVVIAYVVMHRSS